MSKPSYEELESQIQCLQVELRGTRRKERDAAIKELKWQWQTTFDSIGSSVCVLDDDWRILQCNKATSRLLGKSPDEIIGRKCFELVHGTLQPQDCCPVKRLGQSRKREVEVLKIGDSWVEVSVDPILDQHGGLRGIVHIITDITERKRFETDLLHSEQRFRALAELLPQTVFEMDMEGRLTFVNKTAYKIFGYTPHDFQKGLNALDMVIVEDRPRVWAAIQQILQGTARHEGMRFTALRKDGSTFPVLIYSSVNSTEPDNTGLRGIIIDISEQERLTREKDKLEEQYIQSQKMEAIGRLAGGVAHDLNNMLSPILGYGELLLDMVSPEAPGRRAAEQILSAGLRAKDMVRQLLAFSRKQALEIKSINLNQVLASFESLLDRILRDDIQLELKLSRGVPEILADTGQIEQVVMNLAVNAQDAMPDGGKITIEVGVADLMDNDIEHQQLPHAGRFVVMSISDTGHGMDAETRERIFDPFFTTKGQGEGTGLGLATVYGIIKQHNGNIRVYSEPGMGSVFKIHFPAAPEHPGEAPEETRESVILSGTEDILIAEDNAAVRMLAENILKKFGYQTVAVSCAGECIELLSRSQSFDLLLTDVVLQDTNGKELYNQVKAYIPEIKVLYMSGYTDNVIVHHGVLDEGITFLQKPFSVQELLKKVRAVLDGND